MFQKLCFVAVAAMAVAAVSSSRSAHAAPDLSTSLAGTVSDGSASIPYRLFQPQDVAPGQKVPLVLYLHGMGSRGTDNVAQTLGVDGLFDHTRSGSYAAYVLAPQIGDNMWFSSDTSQASEAMSLTIKALNQALKNPNVDTSRVYVTGISMGGFGTWDILRRDPGVFAGAVPISGGGDPSSASALKNVPIWAFHGSADDIVPTDMTRNMVAALQAVGGNVKYTEVAGGNHFIWPSVYADDSVYSWLFGQHLAGGASEQPTPSAAPAAAAPAELAPPVTVTAAVALAAAPTPEPACLGLMLLGGGAALLNRRRRPAAWKRFSAAGSR
jgi:poly(3-hydroxybutyrate) depolymerase